MQELAAGPSASPDLDGSLAASDGIVDLSHQRGQNVTRCEIKIVPRSVKVRRHHRDKVAAMLPPISLTQFQPGYLGDRIPLVRRLERAAQQRAFRNRLGCQARIDTG